MMKDRTMTREAQFEELRPYLFSIAYRMLGSAGDAEDIVQDAFLRWEGAEAEVESPKAYLSKIVTRLSLDHLKSARVRRETYVGPWLPEPLVEEKEPDAAERTEQVETLSMAFLVLLETLTPMERAVFILRDVFDYEYAEIAEIVDRSEDSCRQIAHRAKQHIAARRPRFSTSPEKRKELTTRFLEACALGELEGLTALLSEEIVLMSDGGGKVRAARRPIVGSEKVARFVLGILKKAPEETAMRVVWVNGQPGVALYEREVPSSLLTLDVGDQGIFGINIIVNPDKLTALRP
jgi:RNA polymerase sigma-70 factor (ECF subfamily)